MNIILNKNLMKTVEKIIGDIEAYRWIVLAFFSDTVSVEYRKVDTSLRQTLYCYHKITYKYDKYLDHKIDYKLTFKLLL